MTVRRVPKGHYIELKKDNINSIEQLKEILYADCDKYAVENFLKYTYKELQQLETIYVVNDDESYSRITKAQTSDFIPCQLQLQLGEIA